MTRFSDSDPAYLRDEQYRDDRNLAHRIHLHVAFAVNPYGWHRWVFDRLELRAGERVLELGCGNGDLWWRNRERLPAC